MRTVKTSCNGLYVGVAAALLVACSGTQTQTGSPAALPPAPAALDAAPTTMAHPADSQKIEHVVIIVQMSRSLNNLFLGYPGAKTASYGYDSKNQRIELKPVSISTKWTLEANAAAACNGRGKILGAGCRMNGFNLEKWSCGKPGHVPCPIKYPPYSYVPRTETKPYFQMAEQYVLGDQMYASNFDASSFGSLQYIISAQADGTTGYPSGLPGCGGGPHDWIKTLEGGRIHPCFEAKTLGNELDASNLSWAYYAAGGTKGICGNGSDRGSGYGPWIAYWAIKDICYGPDWNKDIIAPPRQFLADVKNGNLRTVSWITPAFQNSDQAGSDSSNGPAWVASLVNAVGESKYWDSTAIFVLWDSYGGWYDPEPPRYVGVGSLGFRVPLLIISPYAKHQYVSHVHYEHGSILRFAEDEFGLPQLAQSDRRATSPAADCFDFNQAPRQFVPIRASI